MRRARRIEKWQMLIKEDKVEELSNIFNSNHKLRRDFNTNRTDTPLLLFAVKEKSQKVLEYLLSQDFVDKTISNSYSENIYHVVCGIRGAEELFSMIERKVPHDLILNITFQDINAFHIACIKNNIFIVKRVYEILKTLRPDFAIQDDHKIISRNVFFNEDVEVIKYILSMGGIQLNDNTLFQAIRYSKFDIVVYLLNVYLYQSIPSHLHNQFHIFQFSNNHHFNHNISNTNGIQSKGNNDEDNNANNSDDYVKLVEENYRRITALEDYGNRIWHEVCHNEDMDVVKLIFSLKGIQPEILNRERNNVFLLACYSNMNIKVIKYIHKLFPCFINSQKEIIYIHGSTQNGAHLIFDNLFIDDSGVNRRATLNILHYLYLSGIDIHLLSHGKYNQKTYDSIDYNQIMSIYTRTNGYDIQDTDDKNIIQYLKVISQDFDYLHNEHDDTLYRKPSFWKEIDDNSADEQSKRRNEWKNRFEEHVLRHFSKMIQQHMVEPNQP